MNEKKAIYDYKADQRKDKFNGLAELKVLDLQSMPDYIIENTSKYKNWIAD